MQQDFLYAFHGLCCTFQRRAVRQLHVDESIALIFVRKEARRDAVGKEAAGYGKDGEHHNHHGGLLDKYRAPAHVTVSGSLKNAVKPIKESPQDPVALFPRPKQQPGKRRAERERIERGKQNGNRDGNGELLVEPARDAGNESCRHKHGRENQGDTDHRAGEFLHRFQRCVLRRHAFLDVAFHAFHHNYRFVHYEADGQHETKERKRVHRKAE